MDEDKIIAKLDLHIDNDNQNFERFDERFNHLTDKIDKNHSELLAAVSEMKGAQASAGTKSGMITSGVLVAVIEAIRQVVMK